MRTAVDTNILLDILLASDEFGVSSREAMHRAILEGSAIASEIVWAEIRANFGSRTPFEAAMSELAVAFDACGAESAEMAGDAWRKYREAGGRRTRVLPDFLVAAHAKLQADRLLTRDRGFFRRYFPDLFLFEP